MAHDVRLKPDATDAKNKRIPAGPVGSGFSRTSGELRSKRLAETRLQAVAVAAAQGQAGVVAQQQDVLAVER
jgi:hypothetical protein